MPAPHLNGSVASKKTINLAVPIDLMDQFNELCRNYGHGKQKGMVLSAAILMFIRSDPQTQGQFLQEIATIEIEAGVKKMMQRTHHNSDLHLAGTEPTNPPPTESAHTKPTRQQKPKKQAKAAKRAGKAKRAIKKLPNLDDFR